MNKLSLKHLIMLVTMISFNGCVFTDNIHVLNLENKNKPLFALYKDAKTKIRVDKNSLNYKLFKDILIGNANYIPSQKISECLPRISFPYERASEDNELLRFIDCLDSNKVEITNKTSATGYNALAAKHNLNLAQGTCVHLQRMGAIQDINECVREQYKAPSLKTNKILNGVIVKLHENNMYGIIKVNIARKSRVPGSKRLHDLFTEQKLLLIESESKYSDILIYAQGHYALEGTMWGYNKTIAVKKQIISILNLFKINYTLE